MSGKAINREKIDTLVLIGLGLLGSVLLWVSLKYGIGIWHDAFTYINAAENFSNGLGLAAINSKGEIQPLMHFPPVYPIILSIINKIFGWSVLFSAKVLAVICFGFTIFFSGFMVWKNSGKQYRSWLTSLFVLTSPFLASVFRLAMTETLFLPLMLVQLFVLKNYLSNGKRTTLIGSAGLLAILWLTRYVGIFLLFSGFICINFLNKFPWRRRIEDSLIFGFTSIFLYSLWGLRNFLMGQTASGRSIYFHPIRLDNLRMAATTIISWISLIEGALIIRLAVTLLIGGLIIWVIVRERSWQKISNSLFWVLLTTITAYAFTLLVSLTFFDASTRLDNRILSPIYLLIVIIIGILLPEITFNSQKLKTRDWVLFFLLVGVYSLNIVFSVQEFKFVYENGIGYSSPRWKNSKTIQALRTLKPQGPLYSNHSYAINLWSPYVSRWLPETRDWVNDQPVDDFESEIEIMQQNIISENGMLVLFTPEEKWVFVLMGEGLSEPLFCGDGYIYAGYDLPQSVKDQLANICIIQPPF